MISISIIESLKQNVLEIFDLIERLQGIEEVHCDITRQFRKIVLLEGLIS